MFVDALSGAASFAACLRLFRSYPLAVSPWSADGRHRSIVLRCRIAVGSRVTSGFFILSQDRAEHFALRPWGADERAQAEIRPVEPVPVAVHQVIARGMPVPRDGALLGWVSDRQACVLLSVHHGERNGPQIRALPMVGSEPWHWPEFIASPLGDGQLWQYLDQGALVDLAPVVAGSPGRAFWVPSQNRSRASQAHGCVVIRQSLPAEEFWLPAGVYMDHWMLREGVPAPPAAHLLGLPGTVDLSRRFSPSLTSDRAISAR